MSTQIFKKNIPNKLLFDLLEQCAEKKNNYYILTKASYKKGVYLQLIEPFCCELKEYYHISKFSYIERKMSYKNFITIIRQICKFKSIPFTSRIIYERSSYEIKYTIFPPLEK